MMRWLPFEGIAALRFMREGWIQTLFILVGVSLGVAVTVFESSILTGVQANFLRRVLTSQALRPPPRARVCPQAACGSSMSRNRRPPRP